VVEIGSLEPLLGTLIERGAQFRRTFRIEAPIALREIHAGLLEHTEGE